MKQTVNILKHIAILKNEVAYMTEIRDFMKEGKVSSLTKDGVTYVLKAKKRTYTRRKKAKDSAPKSKKSSTASNRTKRTKEGLKKAKSLLSGRKEAPVHSA